VLHLRGEEGIAEERMARILSPLKDSVLDDELIVTTVSNMVSLI
jgi:hypothetical protein